MTGKAGQTHIDRARLSPCQPRTGGFEIFLLNCPAEIAARAERDDTQRGLGCDRCGALEEAADDLIERTVTADTDDHFEAATQSGSRQGARVARLACGRVLKLAERGAQQSGDPIPLPARGARRRGRIDDHETAQLIIRLSQQLAQFRVARATDGQLSLVVENRYAVVLLGQLDSRQARHIQNVAAVDAQKSLRR